MSESVSHPSYYNRGSIEAIDAIVDWNLNFSLGSAVKYITRAGAKDDRIQDLQKAYWYIGREIADSFAAQHLPIPPAFQQYRKEKQ